MADALSVLPCTCTGLDSPPACSLPPAASLALCCPFSVYVGLHSSARRGGQGAGWEHC